MTNKKIIFMLMTSLLCTGPLTRSSCVAQFMDEPNNNLAKVMGANVTIKLECCTRK